MSWCDGWSRTPRSIAEADAGSEAIRSKPPRAGGRRPAVPSCRVRCVATRGLDRWIERCALSHRILPAAARPGVAASLLSSSAPSRYGVVKGDHVDTVVAASQDARDAVANAVGLPHRRGGAVRQQASQPRGDPARRGRDRQHLAAVLRRRTARARSLEPIRGSPTPRSTSFIPIACRSRSTEREAFALWQKRRPGRCHRRRTARCSSRMRRDRFMALPLVVGRAPKHGPRSSSRARPLSRASATRCAPLSWSRSGAGTCGCKNGIDVRLPESDVEQAVDELVALDRDKKLLVARHRRRRPAPARPRDGAADRSGRAGARRGAQGEAQKPTRGRRMSTLNYGLTPKMKPLSPRRTARGRRRSTSAPASSPA